MHVLGLALAFLGGYLPGSFPAGWVAGRLCGKDLRREGSGNIGATNAMRVLGRPWGIAVFAVDFLKGVAGVLLATAIGQAFGLAPASLAGVVGGIGAVAGHNFPVWLGFRGGKGIATSAGVMIALFPLPVFLAALVVWGVLFFLTRYVSVASLGAALALPSAALALFFAGRCDAILLGAAALLCILAFWRHRANIERLLAGTELRFERKNRAGNPPPASP